MTEQDPLGRRCREFFEVVRNSTHCIFAREVCRQHLNTNLFLVEQWIRVLLSPWHRPSLVSEEKAEEKFPVALVSLLSSRSGMNSFCITFPFSHVSSLGVRSDVAHSARNRQASDMVSMALFSQLAVDSPRGQKCSEASHSGRNT